MRYEGNAKVKRFEGYPRKGQLGVVGERTKGGLNRWTYLSAAGGCLKKVKKALFNLYLIRAL